MKVRVFTTAAIAIGILFVAGSATAGGKPDGARCHVHKSCQSKLCLRANPLDKFGECCGAQDCPSLGAQCGEIDNGCGTLIQCGDCGPGSSCVSNQCVQSSTTTTLGTPGSCAGLCGTSTDAGGCYCDEISCTNNDGCADRDSLCPEVCNPPGTTTTTSTTTTTQECPDQTCNSGAPCNAPNFCFQLQTVEESCGVCVDNFEFCQDMPNCTSTSDCAPGRVCIINSCCGEPKCSLICDPPPSTTTTVPPTTTTVPPTTTTVPPPTTTSTTLSPF